MSISVADNFSFLGAKPLDSRIKYDTVADMKNASDATLYDGCLAYVTANQTYYSYDSSNTVDTTTGKWRELETGSGSASSDLPMADTLPTASVDYNGKTYLYTGDNDTTNGYYKGVMYQCRLNPYGDAYEWYPFASNIADGYFIWRDPLYYDTSSNIPIDNPKFKAGIGIRTDSAPTSGSSNFVNSGALYTAFSNKQDKLSYSTSEKAVGTWTNGATIYQRTYIGTLGSSTGATTVASSFSYTIIKYEGVAFNSSWNVPIAATAGGGSGSMSIAPYIQSGALKIANTNPAITSATYYLTIYYLK